MRIVTCFAGCGCYHGPTFKEACGLIKPIIHASYLLYPVMLTLENPVIYIVCAVSDKYELCCINFSNRNSKNSEKKKYGQIHYYCCCLFYSENVNTYSVCVKFDSHTRKRLCVLCYIT
jgi:hypothetical protein